VVLGHRIVALVDQLDLGAVASRTLPRRRSAPSYRPQPSRARLSRILRNGSKP
jgi:hypothetical protein